MSIATPDPDELEWMYLQSFGDENSSDGTCTLPGGSASLGLKQTILRRWRAILTSPLSHACLQRTS